MQGNVDGAQAIATLGMVALGSAGVGLALAILIISVKLAIRSALWAIRFVKRIFRIILSFLTAPFRWNWRQLAPDTAAVVTKPPKKIKVSKGGKGGSKIVPPKVAEPVKQVPTPTPSSSSNSANQISIKKLIANAKSKPSTSTNKAAKHKLELNTLKGHTDVINGIAFTPSGNGLVTACGDMVVRLFQLDDASSKSYRILRLTVPIGAVPFGVAFGNSDEQIVVTTMDMSGSGLFIYGPVGDSKSTGDGKMPGLEIKMENRKIHDKKAVLTCESARNSQGSALVATCSEGTDIKLWSAKNGSCVATVDTNQLQNTMATISPDGRFLIAAAFTTDVKIWEIRYEKDGQVRDVVKVMHLKGHKSAVTWTCFTWDSQHVITASKDGTMRIWNINVRYHLDEDPKCLKVFPIEGQFDRIAVSPDNKVVAAAQGSTLKWLSMENGDVLDIAPNAHENAITCLCWAPKPLTAGDHGKVSVLATASLDKKLKFWLSP